MTLSTGSLSPSSLGADFRAASAALPSPSRPLQLALGDDDTCADGLAALEIQIQEFTGFEPTHGMPGGIVDDGTARKLTAYLESRGSLLGSEIGRGMAGVVFRLEGADEGKVLKLFVDDPLTPATKKVDRSRGAHLIASMNHPSIIAPECALVFNEHGKIDQQLTDGNKIIGYIYPFAPGEDLSDIIKRGKLTTEQVVRYGTSIGEALQAVHAQRIFHRDVKPANVRISEDGVARLMDFDLARISPTPCEPHVSPKGTRAYRAPEVSTPGAYSKQSEAWSLGVILYQMAFQKLPFESEMDAAIGEVAVPRDMHPGLRRVIEGLLQKDPARRMPLQEATSRLKASQRWQTVKKNLKALKDRA